jgi:hypothetical protein
MCFAISRVAADPSVLFDHRESAEVSDLQLSVGGYRFAHLLD